MKCSQVFPNLGSFGPNYSALTANVELIDGPRGKAGQFNESSRMGVFSMGPLHGNRAVSYALWLRSDSEENQILVNTGTIWGNELKKFFNLHLNNGVPEVMVSENQCLVAEGAGLNDGQWHHVAAVMPKDGCQLSEVLIYVDGKRVKTRVEGSDLPLHFNQAVRLGFGGLNYSNKAFDALDAKPFVGEMDEISIWTRPLGRAEILALQERAGADRQGGQD